MIEKSNQTLNRIIEMASMISNKVEEFKSFLPML